MAACPQPAMDRKEEEMRVAIVKIELALPVVIGSDPEYDAKFDIEENHCPGTGRVGAALDAIRDDFDKNSVCWACALGGENEILAIVDVDENDLPEAYEGSPVETRLQMLLRPAVYLNIHRETE